MSLQKHCAAYESPMIRLGQLCITACLQWREQPTHSSSILSIFEQIWISRDCQIFQKKKFNVPFGHNKLPGFPEAEILTFSDKAAVAKFLCADFTDAFSAARFGDVIYCNPPYLDTDQAASFRDYVAGGFSGEQQQKLAELAREAARQGIPVVISNHLTEEARELYRGAVVHEVPVIRNLNAKTGARQTSEGLFVFEPH